MYFQILLAIIYCCFTTATIYYVKSDNGEKCPHQHCHVLQCYTNKQLDSHSQLHFLSGIFHLSSDFVLRDVHNISLTGSKAANSTPNTIIHCNSSVSIVMINITGLIMRDMVIKDCGPSSTVELLVSFDLRFTLLTRQAVIITNCSSVLLHNLHIRDNTTNHGLLTINMMGYSLISQVTCNGMLIVYNSTRRSGNCIEITKTQFIGTVRANYRISLALRYNAKLVCLRISHTIFSSYKDLSLLRTVISDSNRNYIVQIVNCSFHQNFYHVISESVMSFIEYSVFTKSNIMFTISDCQFTNNTFSHNNYLISVKLKGRINVTLKNSFIYNNSGVKLIAFKADIEQLRSSQFLPSQHSVINVINTTFMMNKITLLLNTSQASLRLIGPVNFIGNDGEGLTAMNYKVAKLWLHGNITIQGNHLYELLYDIGKCAHKSLTLRVKENTILLIKDNVFYTFIACMEEWLLKSQPYLPCFFQYYSNRGNLDDEFNNGQQLNYSVIIGKNIQFIKYLFKPIHCSWLQDSAFQTANPSEVYQKFMSSSYNFNSLLKYFKRKNFCICKSNSKYACLQDKLGPIYPGETLNFKLNKVKRKFFETRNDNYYPMQTYFDTSSVTECKLLQLEDIHLTHGQCTKISYTIMSSQVRWCELFVKEHLNNSDYYGLEKFYVYFLPGCPMGFVKYTDRCECDRTLSFIGISTCDINQQAVQRPANSWITADTSNYSKHKYMFSKNCPFDYCLPHPSYVNLSNPDSQCQFNRSGLLCGHCQQHLSATFASSQCKHCSNTYLLLIILFALLGAFLVFVMFIINLTVTEGTVNAFILYVNIVSINDTIFFPLHQFSYVFISIANLDFGIQVCFYNGMDDYAKIWLQLVFPLYLILISVSLIVTSRYSTTIQRLTARRVLPVLATLFLLSFTKTLQTITKVLFSYSEVIQVPKGSTKLIWSVDTDVPLLGVKFIMLFVVCLLLFLIMIPFVVIVLFTRPLLRFKVINKVKPLLDAYQGAYIDKCHCWTGLQLVLRAVFFGVSSLDRNINLSIGIILLSIIIGVHGIAFPYKRKIQNYQEFILLCNLQGLYVFSLYGTNMIIVNTLVTLVFAHFFAIIIHHFIAYTQVGRAICNQQILLLNTFMSKLKTLYNCRVVEPNCNNLELNIPNLTYNYHEYQEPLVEFCH